MNKRVSAKSREQDNIRDERTKKERSTEGRTEKPVKKAVAAKTTERRREENTGEVVIANTSGAGKEKRRKKSSTGMSVEEIVRSGETGGIGGKQHNKKGNRGKKAREEKHKGHRNKRDNDRKSNRGGVSRGYWEKESRGRRSREMVIGKVMMSREGYAFIVTGTGDDDIFVPARRMRGALNGDTVNVVIISKKRGDFRREGEVIEIVERSKRPHIGVLQISGGQAWVIVEARSMPYDIRVELSEEHRKFNGYKVAAIVDEWPGASDEPIGHIVDILGKSGENDTEMHAILTEFGLPYKFDPKVEEQAAEIPEKITTEDIKGRWDFRNVTTFTIDPADAKDFDDALSLKKMDNGNWEVGVHIADVTHYVNPGTLLDKEAYDRATSVYLVDRTVPMLPEKLSNRLCSLRPREEKLTFSAVFEMSDKGKVLKRWFGKTVIKSDYRFSYEEAQQVIEEQKGALRDEILQLHKLAGFLREERFMRGAISFERAEMKVEVDKDGKPINIYQKESKDSNWLIEEFMLLANREVATAIGSKKRNTKSRPFVYRIHEEPNLDKIAAFRTFLSHLGYTMKSTKNARELLHFRPFSK